MTSLIDVVEYFKKRVNEELSAQVKGLLEEKHLYQRVTVEPLRILEELKKQAPGFGDLLPREAEKILKAPLMLTTGSLFTIARGATPSLDIGISLPSVRLYCRGEQCGERQVFRPVWYQDSTVELLKLSRHTEEQTQLKFDTRFNQMFFLALQCQHCFAAPEGVLIRRTGWTFSLDGRSPIEHIAIPPFIPRDEGNLYRDAIIGSQTGKHLAAVFYLRAFIERFARRQTGITGKETGDAIMDAYALTLPQKQREMMPSLKDWYEKLSAPMHAADEDAAKTVFPDARASIDEHFDFRRLYKLPDASPGHKQSKSSSAARDGPHEK